MLTVFIYVYICSLFVIHCCIYLYHYHCIIYIRMTFHGIEFLKDSYTTVQMPRNSSNSLVRLFIVDFKREFIWNDLLKCERAFMVVSQKRAPEWLHLSYSWNIISYFDWYFVLNRVLAFYPFDWFLVSSLPKTFTQIQHSRLIICVLHVSCQIAPKQ